MSDLTEMQCVPCEGEEFTLDEFEVRDLLDQVQDWKVNESTTEIERKFRFKNYYRTMAFVNAVAWVAHHEDHHPNLEVGYNYCTVHYTTHSVGGLSKNDFICAAKLDAL
jgi:4a-hydroxytetrahydrobiopterin dehydratase